MLIPLQISKHPVRFPLLWCRMDLVLLLALSRTLVKPNKYWTQFSLRHIDSALQLSLAPNCGPNYGYCWMLSYSQNLILHEKNLSIKPILPNDWQTSLFYVRLPLLDSSILNTVQTVTIITTKLLQKLNSPIWETYRCSVELAVLFIETITHSFVQL